MQLGATCCCRTWRRDDESISLWPFAGAFRALLTPGKVTLAETYPAEAMRHLGINLNGSKRRQVDRAAVAARLRGVMMALAVSPDPALEDAIAAGFGSDSAGEDRFDCILGVLCVLNVLTGNRPDTAPADAWIRRWEGWVLGQTALPRDWPMTGRQSEGHERGGNKRKGAPWRTRQRLFSVTP